MKKLVKNVLGVFILEDGKIKEFEKFPEDPVETAKKIGSESSEEKQLKEKYRELEKIQRDAFKIGKKAGVVDNREEVYQKMKKVATEYSRIKIKEDQSHDQLLVQAVRRLSELEKMTNKSFERMKAWYTLYFPELKDETENNEDFEKLVTGVFDREKISEKLDFERDSTGLSLDDRDTRVLKNMVESHKTVKNEKKGLEKYIENLANRIMPNVSAVLGGVLAARVLSHAGSLKKLARMPSSTVQVLGAEKALFRHMRGEGSAPKHGVLFLHHTVSGLPEDKRGKMARYLANKTSLAARLDMYNGDFKGDEYRKQIEKKYREMK